MKTLVFCTSYNTSASAWDIRHGMWLRSLRRSDLYYDQLLIVDDASPVMPNWGAGLTIIHEQDTSMPCQISKLDPVVLYRYSDHLGRKSVFEFPGWHRSYTFGILYGIANGFNRIIHIESDAYIVSKRIVEFFNTFESGWFSLWSNKYQMPEIAIQAAAGAELKKMEEFARLPYQMMAGRNHEVAIPFTHIEYQFIGDRYGETEVPIPQYADFSTQTLVGQLENFYWWIPSAEPTNLKQQPAFLSLVQYNIPAHKDMLTTGWSSENDFCWMVGYDSEILLPPIQSTNMCLMRLTLLPCIFADVKQQRLTILFNQVAVKDLLVFQQCDIFINISNDILNSKSFNIVKFLHPDAVRPSDKGITSETRDLSFSIQSITFSTQTGFQSTLGLELVFPNAIGNKADVTFIQTSDEHVYADMLFQTSQTVRHYCKENNYKYEAYIGVKRGYWPYQATFNRIYILQELISRNFQGWAVYLDADAFIVDFDFDLDYFLQPYKNYAFLATPSGASDQYWDVNAGVFFINLAHPTAASILNQWRAAYDAASEEKLLACSQWHMGVDDQQMLHSILHDLPSLTTDCARLPWDIVNSPAASFIRQHLRAGHSTFDARMSAIKGEVKRVMDSAHSKLFDLPS